MVGLQTWNRVKLYGAAFGCLAGLIIFPYFLASAFPLNLLSIVGLALPAAVLAVEVVRLRKFWPAFGLRVACIQKKHLVLGLLGGMVLATIYRISLNIPVLPNQVEGFLFIAALIGGSEELIFRGFLQGYIRRINPSLAIYASAFAHASYKFCLFINRHGNTVSDLKYLFLLTFFVGIFAGYLREKSGSVVPSLAGHVVFDIVVYGDALIDPWWLW